MLKMNVEQAQEQKNMAFCLFQNRRNNLHMYMRSSILVITLRAAPFLPGYSTNNNLQLIAYM